MMTQSMLPPWLKGGLLGALLGLLLLLAVVLTADAFPIITVTVGWLVGWAIWPFIVVLGVLGLCGPEFCRLEGWSLFHALYVALGWGMVGGLIGLLMGKRKQTGVNTSL
mgnify:CR=1 FL=1